MVNSLPFEPTLPRLALRAVRLFIAVILLCLFGGCSRTPQAIEADPNAVEAAVADKGNASSSVEPKLVSLEELPNLIRDQKGKLVLLNLWALW